MNNSLASTRHRVKKGLDEGERDLLPFILKLGELFIGIPCFSSDKTTLQLGPYPLDNVEIIILLEIEATTKRIAYIRTYGLLKDVFILKLIHDSLNPPQRTHAKARDASTNHDISTPMIHCCNLVLGVEMRVLGTTSPLYPIRTKQNVFAFITSKDIFPLFLGPVLVRLRPFHMRLRFFVENIGFLTGRLPFSPAA
ncbi:hypothetical protein AVEN_193993-1 [Araneus ventricosus]|uniref:Uncharacterized protein n=1 Tax=Araneus ventricosus TaxID=182803 RepID=A0A4Y2NI93_ARAVE|nr:hypothetical protein AVEN_193993-1 [Araneus ventricosus]